MQNLSATELQQHLKNHQPLLLDVREPWEWEKCHLADSLLIPMREVSQQLDRLDKTQEIVIICHHGIRSMQVARYLELSGFEQVINLQGGIDAWAKQVDQSVALY